MKLSPLIDAIIPDRLLALQASLYVICGALPPALVILGNKEPFTWRLVAVLALSGLLGGAVALKAFLSTTFAESAVSK